MAKERKLRWLAGLLLICALLLSGCGNGAAGEGGITLTNVSYDPTRELYEDYNQLFADYWLAESGQSVEVVQSHGGSGSQALSVANGLPADVVTLALEADVQSIADAGLIDAGWKEEFANDSSPYTSTIVFLVRSGNPLSIADWDDLAAENVGVIAPNPKTSGAARWIFLAAWAWGEKTFDNDQARILDYMKALYGNVLVLDTGARGSTTTFCENQQGDVLLAWENEAHLILELYPDTYELVTPSLSILCQPSVAVVDEVATQNGSEDVAEAYLAYLYSDEAQQLIGQHYYRPSNEDILQQFANQFDLSLEMTTIDHFGGWEAAQAEYFSDNGLFDQIYE